MFLIVHFQVATVNVQLAAEIQDMKETYDPKKLFSFLCYSCGRFNEK